MMTIALYTGKSQDYHDAIVPLHSFVYARVLLLLYSTMSPSPSFQKNINSRQVYNLAICVSAIMGVGQASRGIPAVLGYTLLVNLIGKISLWARARARTGLRR